MKKLIILLLLSLNIIIYSQKTIVYESKKYQCLNYFEGEIKSNGPIWKEPIEIKKKTFIIINKNKAIIPSKKIYFTWIDLESDIKYEDHKKVVYYTIDKNGKNAYITFLFFDDFTHIYFQYADVIFAYNVVLVK